MGPPSTTRWFASGSPVRDKILFITGDTLALRTIEFLEPNGLPYLAKPFLVEELKLAVNRLLVAGPKRAAPDQVAGAVKTRIASPRT